MSDDSNRSFTDTDWRSDVIGPLDAEPVRFKNAVEGYDVDLKKAIIRPVHDDVWKVFALRHWQEMA